MTYTVTQPSPPITTEVRIRKALKGEWLACPLLGIRGRWVCVDDGLGALWVMPEHIHPGDWMKLDLFVRLGRERN